MISRFLCPRAQLRYLVFWLIPFAAFAPGAASANNQIFAEGRVSLGASDEPDSSTADNDAFENFDAFTLLMPSVVFLRSTPRVQHAGSYTLSTRINFFRSTGNNLSHQANWRSRIATSPSGELTLGARIQEGQTSAYDVVFPRVVEPLPADGLHFVSGELNERYARDLGRAWEIAQVARAGLYYPFRGDLQVDQSYQAGGGLDLRRHFKHEAITGSLRGRYVSISRPLVEGADSPAKDRHIVGNAGLSGSRAFTPHWSAELGAGATGVANAESPSEPIVLPSARAALRYALDPGSAALSYRHDIETRLATSETSAMHLVQLSGALPLASLEDVWVTGSAGFRRERILETQSSSVVGRRDIVVLDGQIAWEFHRGFTASARMQTYQQRTQDLETPSLARQQSRSQLMLSLSARYPTEGPRPIPPGVRAGSWAHDAASGGTGSDSENDD